MPDGTMRFCQQCHAMQPLSGFEGLRRTCIESMARHNARRRERKFRAAATVIAGLERVGSETHGGVTRSGPGSRGHSLLAGDQDTTVSAEDSATLMLRSRDADAELGTSVVAVVGLQRFELEVKLPFCATPAFLPPGDLLHAALEDSLGSAMDTASVAVAPGCVRLVIDGMQRTCAEADAHSTSMAQQLAALLRQRGGQHAAGARVAGLCSDAAPPSIMPLAAVLLPPAAGTADDVAVLATGVLPAGAAHLAVRCWGRDVRCDVGARPPGQVALHVNTLPQGGGCLLVEARGSDGERLHRPRAVVASRDAALVEELNDAYRRCVLPEAAMQAVLHVTGDALTPHATWEVRCAAAAAVSCAGFGATLRQLLHVAEGYEAGAGDALAVVASSHASSAAAMSALHAVAPAAAWADAANRMRTALSDDSSQPHCAAFCALRLAQTDANASPAVVRLLKAMFTVLLRSAENDVDLALDAEDAAAESAAYEAFRTLYCVHEHFISHALALLGFLLRLQKAVTALRRDSWPSDAAMGPSAAALMRGFKLHPLAPGAPLVQPRSVPWQDVVRSLRVFVWYSLLALLPGHLVTFYVSWRVRNSGRAPSARVSLWVLCYANCFLYCTNNLVGDLCIVYATGAAPEWPVGPPTLLHSLFMLWVWRKALFTPALVRATMLVTAFTSLGPLLLVAGPRVVFGNAANTLLAATIMLTTTLAGARERTLKAAYAASMQQRSKAKQA